MNGRIGRYKGRGWNQIMNNLNRKIRQIEGYTTRGLITAAAQILNGTEKKSPKTPVDLGNLRASRFIVTANSIDEFEKPKWNDKRGLAKDLELGHSQVQSRFSDLAKRFDSPVVIGGFSANYAFEVHERREKVNWKRPGSGPKFLQASIARNSTYVIWLIKQEAQKAF